jgi:hypothetical protein
MATFFQDIYIRRNIQLYISVYVSIVFLLVLSSRKKHLSHLTNASFSGIYKFPYGSNRDFKGWGKVVPFFLTKN